MSLIDSNSFNQLKEVHEELTELGEPLSSQKHFIKDYWNEEDDGAYEMGIPDSEDRRAFVFIIHAGRSLNAGEHSRAVELLKIAIKDMRAGRPRKSDEEKRA